MVGEIDVVLTNKRTRSAALPQSAESDSASYQRQQMRSARPKDDLTPAAVGVTPSRSDLLGINRFLSSVLRKTEIDLDQCPATGEKP